MEFLNSCQELIQGLCLHLHTLKYIPLSYTITDVHLQLLWCFIPQILPLTEVISKVLLCPVPVLLGLYGLPGWVTEGVICIIGDGYYTLPCLVKLGLVHQPLDGTVR